MNMKSNINGNRPVPEWAVQVMEEAGFSTTPICVWADAMYDDYDGVCIEIVTLPGGCIRAFCYDNRTMETAFPSYIHCITSKPDTLQLFVKHCKATMDQFDADRAAAAEDQQYPHPATMAEFLSLRPDDEIYLDDDSAEGSHE